MIVCLAASIVFKMIYNKTAVSAVFKTKRKIFDIKTQNLLRTLIHMVFFYINLETNEVAF